MKANGGSRGFEFFIASSRCGTIGTDMQRSNHPQGFKNVIIIQNDPDYQEVWDSARKLSCDWVTRLEKYVTFAPFGVDMLGVKELRFPGDTVDCWMDIQRGHGPFAPAVSGVVPIGEKLTVVIYVRDNDSSFDVHVKDCYAYDTSDYKNPSARAIKLTDERGCPVKEKLVQGFFRTRDVRTSGATIIAYGIINAFKFPERMDVFLACNVEVCKGGCPENACQPEVAVAGDGSESGATDVAVGSSTTEASTDEQDKEEEGDKEGGEEMEDDKKEEDTADEEKTEEAEKPEENGEEAEDSAAGTATEETESSEDTTEDAASDDKKEEETPSEDNGDAEMEDKKEEGGDEEEKTEDDSTKTETAEEDSDTESTDDDSSKTETTEDKEEDNETKTDEEQEEDDEEAKKAAKIKLRSKLNLSV